MHTVRLSHGHRREGLKHTQSPLLGGTKRIYTKTLSSLVKSIYSAHELATLQSPPELRVEQGPPGNFFYMYEKRLGKKLCFY